MSTANDPMADQLSPERLFFSTGILLSAEDLAAEQQYHRGRLARALAYLQGSGTVAGLRVIYRPAQPATAEQPERPEEIVVDPGMAIDRLGRIIEVPRQACIRLDRWYNQQTPDNLNLALHGAPYNGVVADIFVRFVVCEHGKTPAFASGPFDALDAVVPSRLRDWYELQLMLRHESDPPLPRSLWADILAIADAEERRLALHEAIFDAWPREADPVNPGQPEPGVEYIADQDRTAVFLARVVIGADPAASPEERPTRRDPVTIDNDNRLFLYPTRPLAVHSGF